MSCRTMRATGPTHLDEEVVVGRRHCGRRAGPNERTWSTTKGIWGGEGDVLDSVGGVALTVSSPSRNLPLLHLSNTALGTLPLLLRNICFCPVSSQHRALRRRLA